MTYIGYTVDDTKLKTPKRLSQHQEGKGAKATKSLSNIQPILYIKGFATKSDAMKFEYNWKHSLPKAVGKQQRIERGILLAQTNPLLRIIHLTK